MDPYRQGAAGAEGQASALEFAYVPLERRDHGAGFVPGALFGGLPLLVGLLFQGHADSLESFGKIRVFLRKCGWIPESERDAEVE